MKKKLFLLGLVAFCSYPFLGLVIPASIGYFMIIKTMDDSHQELYGNRNNMHW